MLEFESRDREWIIQCFPRDNVGTPCMVANTSGTWKSWELEDPPEFVYRSASAAAEKAV